MNAEIFGFPPGKNITVDVQEFTESGIWYKPKNAKFCFLTGCGGGQAGFNGATATGGRGGNGAPGLQITMWDISSLKPNELVVIGAGGSSDGAIGGDTIFRGHSGGGYMYFAGGVLSSGTNRNPYYGASVNSFGQGGVPNTNPATSTPGYHGSFGPGGGGAGGVGGTFAAGTPRNGFAGGKPRSFAVTPTTLVPETGGGAAGGDAFGVSLHGSNARDSNDVDGFGEGAGGGASSISSTGGNGGNGRRGSGGGGGGGGTGGVAGGGLGGRGGDGFLRIITYCWE